MYHEARTYDPVVPTEKKWSITKNYEISNEFCGSDTHSSDSEYSEFQFESYFSESLL